MSGSPKFSSSTAGLSSPKVSSKQQQHQLHQQHLSDSIDNDINNASMIMDSTSPGAPKASYTSIYDYNDDFSHHVNILPSSATRDRQCSSYADRVLFSSKYYYAYIAMIAINLILIIWLIINLIRKQTSVPNHWLFIVLDIIVNLALLLEVSLQIISQKSRYFKEWSNRFDLFVLVLSIAGLFMYLLSHASVAFEYEGIVIIFFTALRYGVQFLRLLAMIKRQKARGSAFQSRVDFAELKDTDLVFDIDSSDF
ncbi:hypothetical protein SAMD00019534_007540 [Acytostelium subglobosum LB1]|uniref:hypothetical protein n=1 Tax=Acytostelium subglobosum LB1 TaxID=1410327 RepID=UPI0006450867|nr:hypothetical protein SAMD00019534_007540 [Acytostelium subglobosum LB1]GAM17579.1 hypothetical protein SAMD00019534_007540 [Acytostelium subglobosum LB1]|eukprot:XP_012759641.1 hypothetical protein SAMD00019534_007540 [Acytostelium subglobosum LB1]